MTGLDPGGAADCFQVEGVRLYSIGQVNNLPGQTKEAIYCSLLPDELLRAFNVDRDTLCGQRGNQLVTITCPANSHLVEIDVRHEAAFPDPLLYLELADTRLNQIDVVLFVVNDPYSERFGTDRDWSGERTKFGTQKRNLAEEERAMEAGLAPGQVRRGLRLSRTQLPLFEAFVRKLGHEYYLLEPLAYHNAIIFERLGCNYIQGMRRMQWIDLAFQPDGPLHEALDGSTPFRHPDGWRTVRGRSWAIHDGVLGQPWHGVRMYKQVGRTAGVDTFPGGPY